ncbi:hypothetical protein DFH06DRAFT_1230668, partial [Mycena polygramma]
MRIPSFVLLCCFARPSYQIRSPLPPFPFVASDTLSLEARRPDLRAFSFVLVLCCPSPSPGDSIPPPSFPVVLSMHSCIFHLTYSSSDSHRSTCLRRLGLFPSSPPLPPPAGTSHPRHSPRPALGSRSLSLSPHPPTISTLLLAFAALPLPPPLAYFLL